MSSPGTIERPELSDQGSTSVHPGWIVTVFNNEVNTYDEVIFILMAATGCDLGEAEIETWEVDHLGQSVVHQAGEDECRRAAEIIGTIGIRVEVSEF